MRGCGPQPSPQGRSTREAEQIGCPQSISAWSGNSVFVLSFCSVADTSQKKLGGEFRFPPYDHPLSLDIVVL